MSDAQPENLSNKSWVTPHQMSLGVFQVKTCGCGWNRQCVEMVWRQKIWQARDLWQHFFSRKSEKLYKEWFDTPSRNLAQQSIEVHFSVLCSCHQDKITSGGQWTSKTKVSFTLTRHFAQMNFVSIFSHNTVGWLSVYFETATVSGRVRVLRTPGARVRNCRYWCVCVHVPYRFREYMFICLFCLGNHNSPYGLHTYRVPKILHAQRNRGKERSGERRSYGRLFQNSALVQRGKSAPDRQETVYKCVKWLALCCSVRAIWGGGGGAYQIWTCHGSA